jgi:predicted sulfurtransferase
VVLIDVRNIYETEIGRFQCPSAVPVLDPKTRKVRGQTDRQTDRQTDFAHLREESASVFGDRKAASL